MSDDLEMVCDVVYWEDFSLLKGKPIYIANEYHSDFSQPVSTRVVDKNDYTHIWSEICVSDEGVKKIRDVYKRVEK